MSEQPPKKITNNSAASQRKRLLERLHQGPINTFEITAELGICQPAARICELRGQGHPIQTHLGELVDPFGYRHEKSATYYLGGTTIEFHA
ncbi:helix-turn-helix domain-containing protein [Azotobacter salinestris]|uniref:helix-turn-helix domain-containing protein n=1 Tax=Azotobacter salinestris TaxID=69964 RepID=UPI0032E02A1A